MGSTHVSNSRFPPEPDLAKEETLPTKTNSVHRLIGPLSQSNPPPLHDRVALTEQRSPTTRILSPGSMNGTPRSSGELHSISNNSTETLASEYFGQENPHLMCRPANTHQMSSLAPLRVSRHEILMMGYAQITGSFTLDSSLINPSPFEEVKRKGIVGGEGGGGLVRAQSTKRDDGILGSLGWGSLGKTFGGLLRENGISSIKEAKRMSRPIPIISAPQSVLFVDLRLAPGETKSYRFRHPLPRGIPPSHKGTAMKITYNLVIGTQRASNPGQQKQIQRLEIPFRVLPCVNGKAFFPHVRAYLIVLGQGDIFGHDLMSPHTLLSSNAVVIGAEAPDPKNSTASAMTVPSKATSSADDFLSYVEKLLNPSEKSSNSGLLSLPEDETRSLSPRLGPPSSVEELIDLVILNSHTGISAKRTATRFEITRGGDKVAVVMFPRPYYRLGETIPVAIDFDDSDVSCYSLHATLETSEVINPTLALRSKSSIQRVTRRVHASHFETVISAVRVLFSPIIPVNATPNFITTGVNLEWNLRFEFVTEKSGNKEDPYRSFDELMKKVAKDERGSVRAAEQGLACEVFDISIPLRVYGAAAACDESSDSHEFPI